MQIRPRATLGGPTKSPLTENFLPVEKNKRKSTKISSTTTMVIRRGIQMLVLLFLFFQINDRFVNKSPVLSEAEMQGLKEDAERLKRLEEMSCGFKTYRDPLHHEGLPHLVEVFMTDYSEVYFVALNRGICNPEWGDGAQLFSGKTFRCKFDDPVYGVYRTDPVPPVNDWDIFTQAIMVFRCRWNSNWNASDVLPFFMDEDRSNFMVTLHATVYLEANRTSKLTWKSPFVPVGKLGAYRNLRVCHREWPDKLGIRPKQNKKRMLSMVTQILMEYETFEAHDRIRIEIPPEQIITWIEYHFRIGFEHFYVFDNDPKEHGPLERLLIPYIKEGLVTYVWYPVQDCIRKSEDSLDGSRMTISQALSSIQEEQLPRML